VDFRVDVYENGSVTTTDQVALADVEGSASTTLTNLEEGALRVVVTGTTDNPGLDTNEVVADRTQTVDCTGPVVAIANPTDGATFVRGQSVVVDYSCVDAGVGGGTCVGDVADGATLDTSTVGADSFQVVGTDANGNATTVTHDYDVVDARCVGETATVYIGQGDVPTAGDDVIVGTPGPDTVDGGGGDDLICGWGGDDELTGGPGTDLVRGGRNRDSLRGGGERDLLYGGSGTDRLVGGPGPDTMLAGSGTDTVIGNKGNDTGDGGPSIDTCDLAPGRGDVYASCEVIVRP
jgi:Ca2+-binding RTX toxin-like protein